MNGTPASSARKALLIKQCEGGVVMVMIEVHDGFARKDRRGRSSDLTNTLTRILRICC